jgi:hypothetical protein
MLATYLSLSLSLNIIPFFVKYKPCALSSQQQASHVLHHQQNKQAH